MRKILPYLPFLIILCFSALLFIKVNQAGIKPSGNYSENLTTNEKITDMELKTLLPANGKLNFSTYQGKYSVVNLFASWCVACAYEHPLISKLKGDKNLNLIGIAWRDKPEDTSGWIKKNSNPYDIIAIDDIGKYGILLGVTGIPETFVVNPEGVIIMHISGTVTDNDIAEIKRKTSPAAELK